MVLSNVLYVGTDPWDAPADQLRRVFASEKSEDVERVAEAILDCETGDELLARAKNGPSTD